MSAISRPHISPIATVSDTRSLSRLAATVVALAGLALLWAVGFAEIDILHNVAHDTRHSNVFPCH